MPGNASDVRSYLMEVPAARQLVQCVTQINDYAPPCGAGYSARGPAFQRVQPPGKAAAARIGRPTRAPEYSSEFRTHCTSD